MRLLKHHLRRIRLPKVPLCWSGRLGQRPSSQQAVLSTIIIQLLILQIVSHRPSRPEKRIDSRTTTTKLSFCPGSRPDFRTTIEILRSRPEKLAKSRMNSSFCPSHPEKRLDSRMTSSFGPSRPEKLAKSRTTSAFCPSHPENWPYSRTATDFSRNVRSGYPLTSMSPYELSSYFLYVKNG